MIPVKIECDCGQRFAFDVEPVNGRMNTTVACPACGADGTAAANAVLAQKTPPPPPPALVANPVAPPKPAVSLKRAEPEPEPEPAAPVRTITAAERAMGMVDRPQAEIEAHAKISYGDSKDDVIKYLMLQRFTYDEAADLVAGMLKERAATVRVTGVRKILTGMGMICVPVIALIVSVRIGVFLMIPLAVAVMTGLYGCWLLLNGIIALVAPRMESGDIADQ